MTIATFSIVEERRQLPDSHVSAGTPPEADESSILQFAYGVATYGVRATVVGPIRCSDSAVEEPNLTYLKIHNVTKLKVDTDPALSLQDEPQIATMGRRPR